MPPTLINASVPPTRAYSLRNTSSDRGASGAPDTPPSPRLVSGTVVLVATMPASPSSTARSAMSSISVSDRSGAILTSTGVVVSDCTAARIGRSDSTA